MNLNSLQYRQTSIDEIIALRQAVLIAGTERESPQFDGDYDKTTHHFGAFLENKLVGCLTFIIK